MALDASVRRPVAARRHRGGSSSDDSRARISREGRREGPPWQWFNLRQIVLVAWRLPRSSFSRSRCIRVCSAPPNAGHGERLEQLPPRWFSDRSPAEFPRVRVVSVPLLVYRVAMLAWALWIVLSCSRGCAGMGFVRARRGVEKAPRATSGSGLRDALLRAGRAAAVGPVASAEPARRPSPPRPSRRLRET